MLLDPDRAAALLDRLYRTAILITKDPYDAEDLVQDTYELILRRPRRLTGDSELHYLRAAMRRRHVDCHRESLRRVPVVGLDAAPELCSCDDPSVQAEQAEVIAAIRALPVIHRDVLVATYVPRRPAIHLAPAEERAAGRRRAPGAGAQPAFAAAARTGGGVTSAARMTRPKARP